MSGHSKWATIKRKKAANDAKRSNQFAKLLRAIEVAAREGGGDPAANMTLASAVEKARSASVPGDNIDRAIKRGSGADADGAKYEEITYEGYAPGGVAVMVEVLTDNRNRTGADIRNIFSKNGGSTSEPGAVAWQFDRKGQIIVPRSVDEEELMLTALDAGAEDIVDDGDTWRVTTPPTELHAVRTALDEGDIPVDSSDLTMVPQATIALDTAESAKKVLRLIDALDEQDDVQAVHANFDIPDAILETVES
jgi:YebC/PmpR family DNA-binding regulatory protein